MESIAELFPELFGGTREFKYKQHMHNELTFDYVPCKYKLKPPLDTEKLVLDSVWIQKSIGIYDNSNVFTPYEVFAFQFFIGSPRTPFIYTQDDEETTCRHCGVSDPIDHQYVFQVYCFLSHGVRYFYIDESNSDLVDPDHNLTVAEFAHMIRGFLTDNENLLSCYKFISD